MVVTALGGPEVLQAAELPDPVPGPGQVVVRVRAVCVNPADLGARIGMIPGGPVTPPFLLGWDIAGEVTAIGPDVDEFGTGDRVVGMIPWHLTRGAPGGYAELVAAQSEWLVPLPAEVDFVTAATVPLNALTASQALKLLPIPEDSTLLITGASGGVGGFAVQLAAHRVLAVANAGDEEWVGGLGADVVISRGADLSSIRPPVKAAFDAVPIGDAAAAAVQDGGVVVTTRPTPPIDAARGMQQRIVLITSDRDQLAFLVGLLAAGELRTRVAATLPLTEAAQAHRLVEAGGLRGKIVLIP